MVWIGNFPAVEWTLIFCNRHWDWMSKSPSPYTKFQRRERYRVSPRLSRAISSDARIGANFGPPWKEVLWRFKVWIYASRLRWRVFRYCEEEGQRASSEAADFDAYLLCLGSWSSCSWSDVLLRKRSRRSATTTVGICWAGCISYSSNLCLRRLHSWGKAEQLGRDTCEWIAGSKGLVSSHSRHWSQRSWSPRRNPGYTFFPYAGNNSGICDERTSLA